METNIVNLGSAKIFGKVINFCNIAYIEEKLIFEHVKYNQMIDPPKNHYTVSYYVLYMGDKYDKKISQMFTADNEKELEEIKKIKSKQFKSFLKSFNNYMNMNVINCNK